MIYNHIIFIDVEEELTDHELLKIHNFIVKNTKAKSSYSVRGLKYDSS